MTLSLETLTTQIENFLPETDSQNSTGKLPHTLETEHNESEERETEVSVTVVDKDSAVHTATVKNIAEIAFKRPGKGGSSWFPCQCCGEVRKFGNCGRIR